MAIVRYRPKLALKIALSAADRDLLAAEAEARKQLINHLASELLEAACADLRQPNHLTVSADDANRRESREPRHIWRSDKFRNAEH